MQQVGRRAPGDYSRRERVIYRYWDGTREVSADPIQLQRDLNAFPGLNLEADLAVMNISPERQMENPKIGKDADASAVKIAAAVRHAFHVEPYQDLGNGKSKGLTETEVIELLANFGAFIGDLKKKLGIWPTSPKPTGSQPLAEESPTRNGAVCGGTETAPLPDEQPPSISASA